MLYELLEELRKAIEEHDLEKKDKLFKCLEKAGMDRMTVTFLLGEISKEEK